MTTPSDVSFLTTLLPLAGIVFVIAVGVIVLYQHFRKNLYRQMLEQEELKNIHQQELLRSSIEVQEEERKRIAQDMHDELGAVLSIARMQLVQIEQQQKDNTLLCSSVQQVRTTTEAALASMRRLSHELMPPQLENFGLAKTLQSVCEQIATAHDVDISLTSAENLSGVPKSFELQLYRICMEMIHNTIKHAEAKKITIDITQDEKQIELAYNDDGRGLPKGEYMYGLGFKSMEARVNSIGGSMQTGNGKKGGFNASIIIPVKHSNIK